jgi:hypothetical protein
MQQLQEFVEGEVEKGLLGLERISKKAIERELFVDIPPTPRGDCNWRCNVVRTIIMDINPKYIQRGGARRGFLPVRTPGNFKLHGPPLRIKLYPSSLIPIRYQEEASNCVSDSG